MRNPVVRAATSTAKPPRIERQTLVDCSRRLRDVHKRLPVLKAVRWSPGVRERFFARGARELPRPSYRPYDPSDDIAVLDAIRAECDGRDSTSRWLRRTANTLATTAKMLGAAGTPNFGRWSRKLYGTPMDCLPGTQQPLHELAKRILRTTSRANALLPDAPEPCVRAGTVATEVRNAVRAHFGNDAPKVLLVSNHSARASASPKAIRLRREGLFSDLDARQLIQHEAFVHVATSLNGRNQRIVPVLAASHPGTTRTQEGLAVFAELISGSLDPSRLERLARRVVAIQMAADGADFLDVYRYFRESARDRLEAFDNTARVFRGAVVAGGPAFTKDMVYLDGLCRVHVFLRAAIDTGRLDCLPLLFVGKLDLRDVRAIADLLRQKRCRPAKYVPGWVSDPRRLVAYYAVTDVIGRASGAGLRRHYREELSAVPSVKDLWQ